MIDHALGWAMAASLLTFLLAADALAQSRSEEDSMRGRVEYETYCAACHGALGNGQGPAADALKVPPTDLTTLSERYGDPLPRPKLVEFIDGRKPVVSHGNREMPIWGKRLWENVPSHTRESQKRSTMLVIIDYLDSLQKKSE